ncbi:hypothetical protein VE03_10497 [Pseudogymnoascus sp. 23342-1-I1]|nr:hypothetical protein VE03_10497 [Pseudogymnoascus sp. 23342-1-I1]
MSTWPFATLIAILSSFYYPGVIEIWAFDVLVLDTTNARCMPLNFADGNKFLLLVLISAIAFISLEPLKQGMRFLCRAIHFVPGI